MPITSVNGIDLYFERYGEGVPVLNISGSSGDLRVTRPDLSPLNDHFDVLHYDQRGAGRTSKPDIEYSMADYAQDAAQMILHAGWTRAHVVGTSFGGMVAMHLALARPELVNRLVLKCTSPGGLLPSFPLHVLDDLDVEAALELRLGLYDNRWDPGADDPIPGLGRIYDFIVKQSRVERSIEEQVGSRRQMGARADHDVSRSLGNIESETLVCAGEYDDLAPPQNSISLAEGIPNARLRVFQGGHFFWLQDAEALPAIIEFLAD
jgi:3-oxoadipate enol-lactonase